jgi:hypothetical protein
VDPVCLVIIFAFLAFSTPGMHCAELLVNTARDEDVWRTTSTTTGYKAIYSSLIAAAKSWKTLTLLTFKPVVHWLYGLGFTYTWNHGLIMRPAQLLYMSLAFLFLALFGTYISRLRPKGPQPMTCGHVQTIVDLVDEWHGDLFWGHKSEDISTGICSAGTSDKHLPAVMMDKLYL